MAEHSEDRINNKLELVAHLFLIYLGYSSLLADVANIKFKEIGKKNVEFEVTINSDVALSKLGISNCDHLEILLMDINGGQKCMISICSKEDSLKQGIFSYNMDLFSREVKITYPLEKSQVTNFYTEELDEAFDAKFQLEHEPTKRASNTRQNREDSSVHEKLEKLKFSNVTSPAASLPAKQPFSDIPGFEDEYEIQQQPNRLATGAFGVPGLAVPPPEVGYGDQDLYPSGQKYPNLQDPSSQFPGTRPGQGGMIFDPLRNAPDDSRSNPLRGGPNTGPQPPFPGARFDDPFGRASHQGGGGGFI